MTTLIPVVLTALMALSGCDAGGMEIQPASNKLSIAASVGVTNAAVIPVEPESASKRSRSHILTARLQAEKDSVLVRRVAVRIQASSSLSAVLHDAVLTYANSTYPLDHITTESDSSGFLIFDLPSENPVVVTKEAQPLELLAQFRARAHNEQVQAEINAAARQKTVAMHNGRKLASRQKTGAALGAQYRLQRLGAHMTAKDVTAKQAEQGIRFQADVQIEAVGAKLSFPRQAFRKEGPASQYADAGLYYVVEDTSGRSLSSGHVKAATLESTVTAPASAGSVSELRIRENGERTVALSVRYRPDAKVAEKHCFRLAALKYQMDEQTHLYTVSDTTQTHCVRS